MELDARTQPFALIADDNGRKGYLRVAPAVALPVSHFDVGGETVVDGLKGHLYGDRGVWRPGDSIYLTFALQDRAKTLPPNHPVTLELRNPRGQLVQTLTNTTPVGQFYAFELKTAADAPTGNWNATAIVGGATFAKTLKVETVMPNRLKIELDLGDKTCVESTPLKAHARRAVALGRHGREPARRRRSALSPDADALHAQRGFRVRRSGAHVQRRADHAVRRRSSTPTARRRFEKNLDLPRDVPGMLNATFITRVFERGGAFSINRANAHRRGVRPLRRPQAAEGRRGARHAAHRHEAHRRAGHRSTCDGQAGVACRACRSRSTRCSGAGGGTQTGDSLAQYAQGESTGVDQAGDRRHERRRGPVAVRDQVPRVGPLPGARLRSRRRPLHRPRVLHRLAVLGRRARDQSGPAANVLTLTSDKQEYKVGETATVQLPEAAQGRALLTLENGSAILEYRWIEAASRKSANRVQRSRSPRAWRRTSTWR